MTDAPIKIIDKPTVTLIAATPDPERAVAIAARICYAKAPVAELAETIPNETVDKIIRQILASGHGTPLEHAVFTFGVDGISRAASHQLVRHRLASFDEKSQRYVSFDHGLKVVCPPTIADDPTSRATFEASVRQSYATYLELRDSGIPAEDARYVLNHADATSVVMSMNAREWRHVLSLRCCNRAQWEIRELMWAIREKLVTIAPLLFADAGPGCMRGSCPEGSMSCKNPYPRVRGFQ